MEPRPPPVGSVPQLRYHRGASHLLDPMENFFALIGIAVGIALAGGFGKPFWRSLRASNWERVDGKVTHTVVRSSRNMEQSTRWDVRVEYGYRYAGASLTGSTLVGYSGMGRGDAQEIARKYLVGQPLSVYVYKDDPRESKLKEGINFVAGLAVVFGIFLVVFFALRMLP
jgi:hypothetical protein